MKKFLLSVTIGMLFISSCSIVSKRTDDKILSNDIAFATKQIGRQVEIIEKSDKLLNPRTVKDNKIEYIPIDDWTSGFFPGTMWLMHDLTKDEKWKKLAVKYTENLDSIKYLTSHHDVGFIINCSYGNAYKQTHNEQYKAVIIEDAKSLSTRFRPAAGEIGRAHV